MTEKEFLKYGYYFRDDNLRVSRVLVAADMEEVNWMIDFADSKHHFIKTNSSVELIDDYMVMFFNIFRDVKVGCVFYAMNEHNLCFIDLSRELTEKEQEKFDFLCKNEEAIHETYFIKVEDLLNNIPMLEKENFNKMKEFVPMKQLIKELSIDKDLSISFLGTSIYDIQYKGKSFTKKDYEKAKKGLFSREARIYEKIKDKIFNVLYLEEDLKNMFLKEENSFVKKKIQ